LIPAVVAAPPAAVAPLAVLRHAARAHAQPDERSAVVGRVPASAPITGGHTVLPVVGDRRDADGRRWLRVALPGRPNGHTGWIAAAGTRGSQTGWALRVTLRSRTVSAVRDGHVVRRFPAVVGARATPTPVGRFFVEENVRMRSDQVGAPFALALSARSRVLQHFAGGPGQIALHGRGNVGGVLGTAASHGCVRLDNRAITWLARRIVPGTPVTIRR
jgi:lipoprotein-anchoring transpeptidase ErfK/SrfK